MPPRGKSKQYTSKQLDDALEAITNGMSVRKASITFGIPRITLNDRVSGECQHPCL